MNIQKTIKPSLKTHNKTMGWRISLAVIIIVAASFRFGALAGLLMALAAALIIFIYFWHNSRKRFSIAKEGIVYRPGFGKEVTIAFKEIDKFIYVPEFVEPMYGVQPRFFVLLKDRKMISLIGSLWSAERVTEIYETIKTVKSVEVIRDPVTEAAFRAKYPEYLPWVYRNIMLSAVIGGVLICLAIFAGMTVFGS